MTTDFLKFKYVAKYLEESLKKIIYALYTETVQEEKPDGVLVDTEARHISADYNLKVYVNSGEVIDTGKELPENTLLVNIVDDGVVQDSSTPLDISLQGVLIQMLFREEYLEDVELILSTFAVQYKAKIDEIDKRPIQFSIDEGASYSDREYEGYKFITADFYIDILVWNIIMLTNNVEFYIGEVTEQNRLKFSSYVSERSYQSYGDLRKNAEVPYSNETSTFQLSLTGIVDNSTLIQQFQQDHWNNSNFGSEYSISMKNLTNDTTFVKTMILTHSKFQGTFGQAVIYSLDFTTYGDLRGE